MAMTIDGSNGLTFPNSTTQSSGASTAKAWVRFDGTTLSIPSGGSYNVSSITRNGTGDYNVNFTTSLSSANYAPVCTTRNGSIAGLAQGSLTTSTFRFLCSNTSGTGTDSTDNGVHVFGA
jgi:hypothetical protein